MKISLPEGILSVGKFHDRLIIPGRGFLIKFASDRLGENIKLRIKFLLTPTKSREVFH